MTRNAILSLFVLASALLLFFFNWYHHLTENVHIQRVDLWLAIPFVVLLGTIAVAPFINRHWWEHRYPAVSFALGAVVILYYIIMMDNVPRLLLTFHEYVSFISLIGSLYIVSGGIHLKIRGKAAPVENVALLAMGGILANILGTTGASMLLIRPYLRINKYRIKPFHIVFFIFIVSNVGGALTPIGDPPLFLGYLKGVPFFWVVTRVWDIWLLVMGLLLLIFYVMDTYYFRKETTAEQLAAIKPDEPHVSGTQNIFYLLVILGAVFIETPIMIREVLMWGAALASYYTTQQKVHESNGFNLIPIKEVAILFAGIFATMIPALDWLELNSRVLGLTTPGEYYWDTGILSAFLDNAPTYLNFLSAEFGLHGASVDNPLHMKLMLGILTPEAAGLPNPLREGAAMITPESWHFIQAVSIAAVFFGACTYIGNGPNFMVKSIAEQAQLPCPSFFGYMVKYSLPILIPIYALVWYLFFR